MNLSPCVFTINNPTLARVQQLYTISYRRTLKFNAAWQVEYYTLKLSYFSSWFVFVVAVTAPPTLSLVVGMQAINYIECVNFNSHNRIMFNLSNRKVIVVLHLVPLAGAALQCWTIWSFLTWGRTRVIMRHFGLVSFLFYFFNFAFFVSVFPLSSFLSPSPLAWALVCSSCCFKHFKLFQNFYSCHKSLYSFGRLNFDGGEGNSQKIEWKYYENRKKQILTQSSYCTQGTYQ